MLLDHSLKIDKEKKNNGAGHSTHIYKNDLDKACFQHDIVYGDFKNLNRSTAADKVLRDKAFKVGNMLFFTKKII